MLKILLSFLLLILISTSSFAQTLSALATPPNWSQLEKYQYTITQTQFVDLLENIYSPDKGWRRWITVTSDNAKIVTHKGSAPFVLYFATHQQKMHPIVRHWKSRSDLPDKKASKPLVGLHIALDPGHIGGKWAIMEERWLQVNDPNFGGKRVLIKEGDMALKVAKILAPQLRALGATVSLTRSHTGPTTSYRPQDLRSVALSELRAQGTRVTSTSIQKKSEQLFYRVAEIRHRAHVINQKLHPDIVLCLHFNAEDHGGDPKNPLLTSKNHLHFLVAGALSEEEFSKEDQRFDILLKLLSRTLIEEIPLAKTLAQSLAHQTGLPPYSYKGNNAIPISSYVWARNLLATRLFQCPVVFIEPYVMNNPAFVARVRAGDYTGKKYFAGMGPLKSIYREYADSITDGLVRYYSAR